MTADLEKGAIGSEKALTAIMEGMKKYDGMMDKMANETVNGLIGQIQDAFEVNVFRKWGQGLQDGAKKGLGSLLELLNQSEDALEGLGDTLYEIGKTASNWLADKLDDAVKKITEITGSDEFKKGSLTKKINMLWEGVIKNPFSSWWSDTVVPWWDSTVMPWLAEKAASIGKGIGSGLSNGIATLLGIDKTDAVQDGITIGGSFMEGFLEGFDTEKITQALKDWVSRNKALAAGIGVVLGVKLLSGLGSIVGNIKGLFGGGSSGGLGGLGTSSVGTMTVNAAVVNVNGGMGTGGSGIPTTGTGKGTGTAGKLPAGTGTGTGGLLVGSKGTGLWSTIKTGAGKVGGFLGKAAPVAGIVAGTGLSIWDGIQGGKKSEEWLGEEDGSTLYGKLSAGTSAAVAGTSSGWKGALGNAAKWGGLGAGIGSLIAPGVGTAIGGGIGAVVGGVTGFFGGEKIAQADQNAWDKTKGFFKSKYYGDAYDNETGEVDKGFIGETGGWVDTVNSTKKFFTETIPEKWNGFWDGVGSFFTDSVGPALSSLGEKISSFFTETIPEKWNGFWDSVGNFFTGTVGPALSSVGGKISEFFTETIPEKWNEFWEGVGNFFTETVPYAYGYSMGVTWKFFSEDVPLFFKKLWNSVERFFTETLPEWAEGIWNTVSTFFTETVPEFFGGLWDAIATFFTETLPEWAEKIWDPIATFFTETIPGFFAGLWGAIATFFTETLPEWAEGIWNSITTFFTETVPGWFVSLWDGLVTFVTETIPEWIEGIFTSIANFFTVTIPGWFASLWSGIVTFVTETIPEWTDNIWNGNIVPFFTETIPSWFGGIWDSISGFFTDTLGTIAEAIWSPIKSFFTETIPGWVSSAIDKAKNLWGTIKDSFLSGFESGSSSEHSGGGGTRFGNARGGVIYPTGYSGPGYAAGGLVRGGSRLVKVAEEGTPEMIIPLGSHRRERGLKLWAKAGEMLGLGVAGFERGGLTVGSTEGVQFHRYDDDGDVGEREVRIDVGGVQVDIHVDATGNRSIIDEIREQGAEIAETVAGILVDAFDVQFPNAPARGGA